MPDQPTPAQILTRPYSRIFIWDEESHTFFATIAEFTGCFTQGETLFRTNARLTDAAESWILAAQGLGHSIPEPFPELWWQK